MDRPQLAAEYYTQEEMVSIYAVVHVQLAHESNTMQLQWIYNFEN